MYLLSDDLDICNEKKRFYENFDKGMVSIMESDR